MREILTKKVTIKFSVKEYESLQKTSSPDLLDLERLKLELKQERERSLKAEKIIQELQNRLTAQVQQERIAAEFSDKAIFELEKKCLRTSEELEALKLSSHSSKTKDSLISTASTENFANIETAPQIEEDIGSLKLKIELVKKNLETTLDSEDTLKNEFSNLNIEFESFLSETDYSQTDSFLISGNVQK